MEDKGNEEGRVCEWAQESDNGDFSVEVWSTLSHHCCNMYLYFMYQ